MNMNEMAVKKAIRKIVHSIDSVGDLVEPLTSKMENFTGENARTVARNIFKGAWNTVKGWF